MSWVLVTGASSGIGEAFARALAREGRDVMLAARRMPALERVAAELRERHGVRAEPICADLSTDHGASNLLAASREIGAVSVLVNNAGLTLEGRFGDHAWTTQEAFLRTMLIAPCELVHGVLPDMLERGAGTVINVASVSGYWPCTPMYTLYAATKTHLIKFSRALSEEYRGSGVTFTAVCPGITRTAIIDEATLAGENARSLPKALTAEPEVVVDRALASARAGRTVVVPTVPDRIVATVLRHAPEALVSRAIGSWLTSTYDRWAAT